MSRVKAIREPMVKLEIICPVENIGDLMKLADARRGIFAASDS